MGESITMTKRIYVLTLFLYLAVTAFPNTRQALGALGESVDSVESDRMALSAVRHAATARTSYTIHEVTSDAATVREYVSLSGVVFAIAWNGLSHPDLTPLLASYDGEYRQALRGIPRAPGRRHLQVKTERIVVEKWGHMRNLQGRAYVP